MEDVYGLQTCNKCHEDKYMYEYKLDKKVKSGVNPTCNDCRSKLRSEAEKKQRIILNKAKSDTFRKEILEDSNASWLKNLVRTHNITIEDYFKQYEKQDGKCAICFIKPKNIRLYIDHHHPTDTFRGLLCRKCNLGIGHFEDDYILMVKAAKYVRDHNDKIGIVR